MSYNNALEYLTEKLDEQRESVANGVIRTVLPEGEYARLCGVIQGIDFAKQLIKDLAKRLENDDE